MILYNCFLFFTVFLALFMSKNNYNQPPMIELIKSTSAQPSTVNTAAQNLQAAQENYNKASIQLDTLKKPLKAAEAQAKESNQKLIETTNQLDQINKELNAEQEKFGKVSAQFEKDLLALAPAALKQTGTSDEQKTAFVNYLSQHPELKDLNEKAAKITQPFVEASTRFSEVLQKYQDAKKIYTDALEQSKKIDKNLQKLNDQFTIASKKAEEASLKFKVETDVFNAVKAQASALVTAAP